MTEVCCHYFLYKQKCFEKDKKQISLWNNLSPFWANSIPMTFDLHFTMTWFCNVHSWDLHFPVYSVLRWDLWLSCQILTLQLALDCLALVSCKSCFQSKSLSASAKFKSFFESKSLWKSFSENQNRCTSFCLFFRCWNKWKVWRKWSRNLKAINLRDEQKEKHFKLKQQSLTTRAQIRHKTVKEESSCVKTFWLFSFSSTWSLTRNLFKFFSWAVVLRIKFSSTVSTVFLLYLVYSYFVRIQRDFCSLDCWRRRKIDFHFENTVEQKWNWAKVSSALLFKPNQINHLGMCLILRFLCCSRYVVCFRY